MSTPVENRLLQLQRFGQSPWFDYISRPLVAGGGLKRMVDRDGLGGVTSNPSIFEKAIGSGKEYDREILELAHQGLSADEIFDRLAIDDVRAACDVLAPGVPGHRRRGRVRLHRGLARSSPTTPRGRSPRRSASSPPSTVPTS